MLEYINNLNFDDSMNKDIIMNLYKTNSSNINSIILSKIHCHNKISDFFSLYSDLDINSISKSINNINSKLSNIFLPNSKFANDNLEQYISILTTFILTIHYILKIKKIFQDMIKEFQQYLIKNMLNNNLGEPYKDKIIEYNCLSNSAFNYNTNDYPISNFIENKPKIFNHFDQNGKRFFDLESPTPKFFVFEKESKEIRKDSLKSPEEKKENEITRVTRKPTKSSCSLISMSSIIVINKNQEVKEQEQDKPINRFGSRKKCKRMTLQKKNTKLNEDNNNITERKVLSDKALKTRNNQNFEKIFNDNKDYKYEYIPDYEEKVRKNSRKLTFNKEASNIGSKELFIELLKFANDLYQKKYIDESQKKILKQLIIMYIK
jgi:hypothetical protein